MKFNTKSINDFIGQKVSGTFILMNVENKSSTKAKWQEIKLSDAYGSITSKVWEKNMSDTFPKMVGKTVVAVGNVVEYNGNADFTVEKMELIELKDLSGVIPTATQSAIDAALNLIRGRAAKIHDDSLRGFCSHIVSDSYIKQYADYCDTECHVHRSFFIEMGYIANVFIKMIGLYQDIDNADKDLVYASLLCYEYGLASIIRKEGYSFSMGPKAKLTGRGYEAGKFIEAAAAQYNEDCDKHGTNFSIAQEILDEMTHCCLVMDGTKTPCTREAELAALVLETYWGFKKGARTYGRL